MITCDYMWSTIYEVYSTIKKLQHYRKVSVLVQPSYLGTWIRPCTSGSSNECQQRVSRCSESQFPLSITSISRSLFANSRALAKSFSSVVFLVRLSHQFGFTGRKAAWRSEISSRSNCDNKCHIWGRRIVSSSANYPRLKSYLALFSFRVGSGYDPEKEFCHSDMPLCWYYVSGIWCQCASDEEPK